MEKTIFVNQKWIKEYNLLNSNILLISRYCTGSSVTWIILLGFLNTYIMLLQCSFHILKLLRWAKDVPFPKDGMELSPRRWKHSRKTIKWTEIIQHSFFVYIRKLISLTRTGKVCCLFYWKLILLIIIQFRGNGSRLGVRFIPDQHLIGPIFPANWLIYLQFTFLISKMAWMSLKQMISSKSI